jgi:hypothetical protein
MQEHAEHVLSSTTLLRFMRAVADCCSWSLQEAKADVPLLKLFEFLTASLCLYVIEEEPACPLHK